MKGIVGKKLGMTQVYNEAGEMLPVTVVEAGPCPVLALRTRDKHGYSALQIGFGQRKAKNVSKAVLGHLAASDTVAAPPAAIREIRLDNDPERAVGDTITADVFEPEEFVDVTGTSKGRGFQGVVKRWRFGGGRASHGGGWTRRPGSIGMCVSPARVYKGRKMPGQMGNVRRTVQNLQVVGVRPEENLILLRGSVPGPNGGLLIIRSARKKN
jgi:large subunit ribosomal protein L3